MFVNDGDPQVYIGSADMMHRNLDRRVEALVRVVAPAHLAEIERPVRPGDGRLDELVVARRPTASGPATRPTKPGKPLIDLQDRHDARDRPAQAHRTAPMTETGDLRRGRRLLAHRRRQAARAGDPPHAVRRRHPAQGQGRPRRDRSPRRRCARSPKRPASPSHSACRSASRATRCPSRREKIVHYWSAEVTERAIAAVGVRAERRDRRPRVGDAQAGARLPELPGRRRDPREFRQARRRGRASHLPDHRAAPRQGRRTRRLDARRCRASADRTRGRAGRRPRAHRSPRAGLKRIISSPAVRCVTTVAPLGAATGINVKRDAGISQDAWEAGKGEVRRVVGKRVRSRKTAVLCSHGPVLPEIMREIALATGTPLGSYLRMPRRSSRAPSASCTSRRRTRVRASSPSRRTLPAPSSSCLRALFTRHPERQRSFTFRLPTRRKLVRRAD